MDKWIVVVSILATIIGSVTTKSLPIPPYITPCSRNEPDLSACILKRGREAIPSFINGDRKYKIPLLEPLSIDRLHVDEGVLGLNFTGTNLKIGGLRHAIFKAAEMDFKKGKGFYEILVPNIKVDCDYEIDGRILILPIQGAGRANITFVNASVLYTFDFELVKKDGELYTIPTKSNLIFDGDRMYVYLANLFNGNKLLGDEMNRFMDENWKELIKELGPVVGQAIGEVMRRIQKNVFELVSYDLSFPDVPV